MKNQCSVISCKIQTSLGDKFSEINITVLTCICYMVLVTEKYINNFE